jgi:hypothetical protein
MSKSDNLVKGSRGKARKCLGVRRTVKRTLQRLRMQRNVAYGTF